MIIVKLILLLKVLGIASLLKVLVKYVVMSQGITLNVYGREITLTPTGTVLDRLRYGLGRCFESIIREHLASGDVGKSARLLGLDSAWFENNSVCAEVDSTRICAPKRFALRLLYTLREVFVKKIYGSVSGMQVIDIGAWVGDTAIYFARKNELVVGLEPVKEFYEYFKQNIRLNNLDSRVVPLHAAYSLSNRYVKILEDGLKSRIHPKGETVTAINLRDIIEKYNMDNVFLKVDCEGCEYELIRELPEVKDYISSIAIEVHKHLGDSSMVIKELESNGFRLRKILENPNVVVLRGSKTITR